MMYRLISLFIYFLLCYLLPGATFAAIVPAPPKLNATSYLVMDHHSGQILVAEKIDERVEPASLTKMMTAYVVASELAAGSISLDDKVLVSEKAWRMQGSRMFIEVNKKVSVDDLLKGVIVQSGNDASIALAEYVAGSDERFAELMNQHAASLGMHATNFVNSTGLPNENHYTTARDLATLSSALIKDFPSIYAMHAMTEFTYNGIKQPNRNQMLSRDDSVDGIKTGHTESAGYCLVTAAKRGDMRIISVVMGTEGKRQRVKATQALLNFSFRYHETRKLYNAHEVITTRKIWKGDAETVDLGIINDLYITIPRGKYKKLDASIELDNAIIAPIAKGQAQGNLRIVLEGKELISRSLIALQTVNKGSLFIRLKDDIKLLFE